MTDAPVPTVPAPRRRLRRATIALGGIGLVGLVSTEAFLRVRYGLGDPPVMISDTRTEYRMRPDGHYRRLGRRMEINQFSMRSDPLEPRKTQPAERRVLFLGDSVIFGGAYTDQADLATSIVQARLRREGTPAAYVGNVSAGSWGPQNQLGYVEEFGLFEADVVVIVISSHDAFDEVVRLPAVGDVPSATYWSAIGEAWDRVRPRLGAAAAPTTRPDDPPPNHHGDSGPCLEAFGAIIDRVRAAGATPIVAFHYERPELDRASDSEGHRLLREVCAARGIEPVSLAPAFRASIAAGEDPYRDEIHPNEAGQRAIAAALTPVIEAALRSPTTRP